jgi:hypothetical protein
MDNPKAALAAINAIGETVGKVTLTEVTLSKAAILEQIGSPVMSGKKSKDITLGDVLPTLFVLATPALECKRLLADKSFDKAVTEWGDSIPVMDGTKLVQAMKRIMQRISDVAPQGMVSESGSGEGQKKTGTAG